MSATDVGRPRGDAPGRNLALELVRVTEAGALAAARFIGMGDKEGADQAAVDAMRLVLETVPMTGVVVIGEGEKGRRCSTTASRSATAVCRRSTPPSIRSRARR